MARPARSAGSRGAGSHPGTRPVLTGRALLLGVLVVLLVVVLASPVNRFLRSRSQVSGAAAKLQHDREQRSELTQARARYGDPGYIQAQARAQLQFAMPGDTVYVVVDKGAKTQIERTRQQPVGNQITGPSWNDRLFGSVRAAAG